MKLYKIFQTLIDVFQDDGWEQWSRWKRIKGNWFQVAGTPIEHPAFIIRELKKEESNG